MRRALITAAAAVAALVVTRPTAYAIAEGSMEPALHPGDWVLGTRRLRRIRRGDVVVVEHPERPGFDLVKRVAAAPGDEIPGGRGSLGPGEIWVLGDNPAAGSVDSRVLGPIPRHLVRARLLVRYRPLPPSPIARR